MTARAYYDRKAGVAYFMLVPVGETATCSERWWGRVDYDGQGAALGIEISDPVGMLPADLLALLPEPEAFGSVDS